MRIAFLTWRDSTHPDGGGSEVFVEEVSRELVDRGHDVTILCARHPGSLQEEDWHGVRIERLGGRLTVYPRAAWRTWRRRGRLDVVIDVVNGLPFGTPLFRQRGVLALLHHVHERQWHIIYPGLRGRVGWFVESRLVPLIYRGVPFLTVSEASRRDLTALGIAPERVAVARNGLRAVAVPVAEDPEPRVSVLARLVPHKRIEIAIRCIAELASREPRLHLDIVGEGWWHEQLTELVRTLGMEERVSFHGRVPDATRDRILARSWLMLLPSVKEGWGLAVLEAAAQGTPTVAFRDAGGVNESVLDGRTGVLVDDEREFCAATARLLANPVERRRLGAAARDHAAAFTWSATADAVEKWCREVAAQRSP